MVYERTSCDKIDISVYNNNNNNNNTYTVVRSVFTQLNEVLGWLNTAETCREVRILVSFVLGG